MGCLKKKCLGLKYQTKYQTKFPSLFSTCSPSKIITKSLLSLSEPFQKQQSETRNPVTILFHCSEQSILSSFNAVTKKTNKQTKQNENFFPEKKNIP